MQRVYQWAIRLSEWGEWIGVAGIIIMVVVTCADVLGAKLFMAPVPGSTEIISLIQVAAIVFAVSFLWKGKYTAMDTLPWIGVTGDDGWYLYTNERREIADFIKENRSRSGQFELAALFTAGPGNGSFFVTEQFALHQFRWNGGYVEGHKGARTGDRIIVDGFGNQFFPCPGLAEEGYGDIGFRCPGY